MGFFSRFEDPTRSGFAIDGGEGGADRRDRHARRQKTETLLTIATTSNRLLACQFLPTIGFGFPFFSSGWA
jgi:hypothetical protein